MYEEFEGAVDKVIKAKVKDIMRTQLVVVGVEDPIIDVAKKMAEARSSYSLVMERERVVGIITERDLVRRVLAEDKDPKEVKAEDVMSSPIIAVIEDSLLTDAALIMAKNKVRKLVVVNKENRLVGVVTASDLAKILAYQMKLENMLFNALAREAPPPSKIYE